MHTPARLALALFATLLLVELGLRGYRAAIDQVPPHPDPSVEDEWEWARDHLRAGKASLTGVARYDAELGWITVPKARAADGGRIRKLDEQPPPGVRRIVFVGDSFMRELGAMNASFLPGWEVLNLAVQGYGAGQTWLRYHTVGARYGGEIAVFGFYLRDYFRIFRSFRGYAKPTFALDEGGRIVVGNVPVIAPEALLEAYRTGERRIGGHGLRSYVLDFVRGRMAVLGRERRVEESDLRLLAAFFTGFRDDARAAGACPFLLIFPTRPDGYDGAYPQLDRRTRALARELDLPYLALADGLFTGRSLEEQGRWYEDGGGRHMSREGRAESIRLLDEALAGYEPGRCPAGAAAD